MLAAAAAALSAGFGAFHATLIRGRFGTQERDLGSVVCRLCTVCLYVHPDCIRLHHLTCCLAATGS